MKAIRSFFILLFISLLRKGSLFNYRKNIVHYIKTYHSHIQVKKGLTNITMHPKLIELGIKKNDHLWPLLYSSINEINSINYIPETVYYFEIEPRLNKLQMRVPINDKSNYNRYLTKHVNYKLPEDVFMNIDGFLYDSKYHQIDLHQAIELLVEGKYMIKPTLDSGGGKNINLIEVRKQEPYLMINNMPAPTGTTISAIIESYDKNFIVQKYIIQHQYFENLNPDAVNSMRIMTYKSIKDDKAHVIQRVMKIGKKGSITDNEWSGCTTIGYDSNGVLNPFGVNKYGVKTKTVNGFLISEIEKNPFAAKLDLAAIEIANEIYYSRALGMDIAVDQAGDVVFIEVNNIYNGINCCQYNNGPLFGDFTDEVLDYCLKTKREHFILY